MNSLRMMVTDFQMGHTHIGELMCCTKWIDNEWSSVPPEVFTKVAEAIADDDLTQAGALLKDAFSKIAHREAEHTFGVKL
jgi:hypothetical protein